MPADCADGEYCKVNGCAATGGTCTKKPANVPTTGPLVCGCDDITYWNESLAARFGVSVKTTGICANNAKSCSEVNKCPDKRFCNMDVNGANATFCAVGPAQGRCWGIPDTCPTDVGEMRACPGSGGDCTSYCAAVREEHPFFHDKSCPNN